MTSKRKYFSCILSLSHATVFCAILIPRKSVCKYDRLLKKHLASIQASDVCRITPQTHACMYADTHTHTETQTLTHVSEPRLYSIVRKAFMDASEAASWPESSCRIKSLSSLAIVSISGLALIKGVREAIQMPVEVKSRSFTPGGLLYQLFDLCSDRRYIHSCNQANRLSLYSICTDAE